MILSVAVLVRAPAERYTIDMPRKPRVEFEGAVYHVMCRGDHREPIVQDDVDRAEFVRCLGDACGKTDWHVHAYALLGNHYHILLETPRANLVSGMHWFQGTYTVRYNRRHRLHGHLFQGRYKPLLIEPETRISQSVRAVTQAEDGELLSLRQTLEKTLKITD